MEEEIEKLLNTPFKISLDHAAELILAFIQEPELRDLALKNAIGGTVSREAIKKEFPATYSGCMGWYCKNTILPEYPELFMAFEDGTYEVAKVPTSPVSANLIYSSSTFKYSKVKVDFNSVKDMLLTDDMPLKSDEKIPIEDVKKLINKMPADQSGVNFNKYPCSFFENRGRINHDVDDLLTNNVVAVRYYFGYDNHPKYKDSNRIRVVLIGVDSYGKNIISQTSPAIATSEIIQNSWPPPPPPPKP